MIRNERTLTSAFARLLLCAALLTALPLVTACGGNHDNEAAQGQNVQVQVTDQQIQMPASLPMGRTTFEVTNSGSHAHSFGITGPAGDKVLEEPLEPGETATLEMDLATGTYRVYCPVDQNSGHALQVALNVTPSAGAGQG